MQLRISGETPYPQWPTLSQQSETLRDAGLGATPHILRWHSLQTVGLLARQMFDGAKLTPKDPEQSRTHAIAANKHISVDVDPSHPFQAWHSHLRAVVGSYF